MTGIHDVLATETTERDYRQIIVDQIIQIQKVTRYAYELEQEIVQLRYRLGEMSPPENKP